MWVVRTRWIERHEGVRQFRTDLPKVVNTLDEISEWDDDATSGLAAALRAGLCDSEFLFALVCLSDVLDCTLSLSRLFQKKRIDAKMARDAVQDTLKILSRKRDGCEQQFRSIYEEVSGIATGELSTTIQVRRIPGRQQPDPLAHYRQTIYIPILENVTEDIKTRFSEETIQLYNLSILFPRPDFNADESEIEIRQIATKYVTFFDTGLEVLVRNLKSELISWNVKWRMMKMLAI